MENTKLSFSKRIAALFLVFAMLAATLPASVFAAGEKYTTDTFDENMYKADLYIDVNNPSYYKTLVTQMNIKNPSEVLADTLRNDGKFLNKYKLWTVATFDPSKITEDALTKDEWYLSMIFDAFKASSEENEFLKAIKESSAKDAVDLESSIVQEIPEIATLIKSAKIKDYADKLKELSEKDNKFSKFLKRNGTATEKLGLIIDASNTVYDCIQRISAYVNLSKLDKYYKSVLEYMYDNCGTNIELRVALDKASVACNASGGALALVIGEDIVETVDTFVITQIAKLWEKIIENTPGNIILLSQKGAKAFANLAFSTDKIFDKYFYMEGYTEVLNLIKDSVQHFQSSYASNQNIDTANELLSSIDVFYTAYIAGCGYAQEFLDIIYKDAACASWPLVLNDKDKANYKNLTSDIKSIKSDYELSYQLQKNTLWKCYLEADYPDIYLDYAQNVDGFVEPVDNYVPVKGIQFEQDSVEWGLKDTMISGYGITFIPDNATNKGVTYSSSNESVVRTSKGTITPVAVGTATITATSNDGGYKDTLEVTIVADHGKDGVYIDTSYDPNNQPNTPSTTKKRDVVLVLDVSGSMSGEPLTEMKASAKKFCEQVLKDNSESRVAIVCFSNNATSYDFSSDITVLNNRISAITDKNTTNMTAGITAAESLLKTSDANTVKCVVIMADGLPNEGNNSSSGPFSSSYDNGVWNVTKALDPSYHVYSLGFFHSLSGSNKERATKLMSSLTNIKDGYYEVTDADNLNFAFGEIADDTSNDKNKKYITIKIECPVDVTITKNGETLSSSATNLSMTTSFGSLVFEGENNDVKVLRLIDDTYEITLNGTGTGTMTYTISWFEADGTLIDSRVFKNIPLTPNTKIITNSNPESNTTFDIDKDGNGSTDIQYEAKPNSEGVKLTQEITALTLDKTSLTLKRGEKSTLAVTVSPSDLTVSASDITWTSSDKSVATVSETGEVKGINAGKATITATAENGVSATCEVTVRIVSKYYTVNASSNYGGIVSPKRTHIVKAGNSDTIKISPYYGYKIDSVTVNDKAVPVINNTVTLKNIDENCSVYVKFVRADKFNVTVTANKGGYVSHIGTSEITSNGFMKIAVIPKIGYRIKSIKKDGISIRPSCCVFLTKINEDHTVDVEFEKISRLTKQDVDEAFRGMK